MKTSYKALPNRRNSRKLITPAKGDNEYEVSNVENQFLLCISNLQQCFLNKIQNEIEKLLSQLLWLSDNHDLPCSMINEKNVLELLISILFEENCYSLYNTILMLISNVIISPEVDLTILSSADFMHKLLQFNNGRIDENILNFFCYLLDDNLEGCHSLVEVGFVDHLLNMFDSLPISHQYQICKIFSFIITSEVRCQPLAEFLRYRMDVIDEQSHFTFELFITALKNGYDNDINGFLLFQLSTFDSEEKAYSAFKLISYLFETHEQETLAYFSWGAFSQFVKFEHEDETWISFCSMINSVFKYDTAQAELSLKYHIDDFLLGVFQNSSFSLKEIAIETLANLAKVNMENLLSKGYVTILIDFLCVPNDDLFILLVNSLFYLAFYAKGGKLTTEIATQFAECELALTLEGILNTGLSENCERLSVALMNNVCELTEFLS